LDNTPRVWTKIASPFYVRPDYREDQPRLRQVVRFVPEKELDW
jgi:hypothetical protein